MAVVTAGSTGHDNLAALRHAPETKVRYHKRREAWFMGMVQLPDALQRLIDHEVAEGHAVSAAAFVEEAVIRLVDDLRADEADLSDLVQAGIADLDAGRYLKITSPEDGIRLLDTMMAEAMERPVKEP